MKVQIKSWWKRFAGGKVLWTCLLLVAVCSQPAWAQTKLRAQMANCSMQDADCCGMDPALEVSLSEEAIGCCAPESPGPVLVGLDADGSCACRWDAGPTSTPKPVLWHSGSSSWGSSGTAKRWVADHFSIAFKSLQWSSARGWAEAPPKRQGTPEEDSSSLAHSRGSSCHWNRLRRRTNAYLAFLSIARI